jgi:hypothetical protein
MYTTPCNDTEFDIVVHQKSYAHPNVNIHILFKDFISTESKFSKYCNSYLCHTFVLKNTLLSMHNKFL